jgi:transcriptional regulator with GAF, ATPase, and Fis domain
VPRGERNSGDGAASGRKAPSARKGQAPDQSMLVAGWEPSDARWAIVEDVCAACAAEVFRFTALGQVQALTDRHPFWAAIVGFEHGTKSGLTVVSHLKRAGLDVIAYEDGLDAWPVSAKCRALLAGAKYLLDSHGADFKQRLGAILNDLLAALKVRRSEEQGVRALARSHGIVGESDALLESFRQIIRFSRLSDLPVLITGESGTGKELFASALHALDPKRCRRPFVTVNCAAINAGVAESELFGHVRGAFTGAAHDHHGHFLAAQGGVLFLDEIGELGLEVQAKILRVLQEKRLFRVGAEQETVVDLRIVAATNQDLGKMLREGRFREDLFHRLNTLSVTIRPLRERKDDLKPLIDHFVALSDWRGYTQIDADLTDALSHLEFSGNVRELKNLITAALVAKTDHSPLGLKDLPLRVWEQLSDTDFVPVPDVQAHAATAAADSPPAQTRSLALSLMDQEGWNLAKCLSQCEREIIEAAIQHTRNNQSHAARLLGLTPRSIYNKLRKYELFNKPA